MRLKIWLASILLAFAPVAASAVPLFPGAVSGFSSDAPITYENNAFGKGLKISALSFTFQNAGNPANLEASSWSFTDPDGVASMGFFAPATVFSNGSSIANVEIPNFNVDVGESFSLDFTVVGSGTSGSYSFAVAPIPLPAAAWMLLSAIGGMGLLARRRTVKTA